MPCALILSAGTRGDVEPLCVLAEALACGSTSHTAESSWTVILCVQSDYDGLVPTHENIQKIVLPFTQQDMVSVFQDAEARETASTVVAGTGQQTLFQWSMLGSISRKLTLPCTTQVLEAAAAKEKVDVVVYTLLQRAVALNVVDKLQAKTCYMHLQPQVPTALFPHHRNQEQAAAGIVRAAEELQSPSDTPNLKDETHEANAQSYWDVEDTLFKACGSQMNSNRTDLGLDPLTYEELCETAVGKRKGMIILNSFPATLVPHPPDLEPTVHAIGPLADAYLPKSWTPPSELEEFLAAGEPPVRIGFGSMRTPDGGAKITQLVYAALRAAGVLRAVVVGGRAGINTSCIDTDSEEGKDLVAWADMHVMHAGAEVPYAWLLPKCRVMVCQGGAGVVAASLRASTAVVVCPVLAEQFMWGRVLDSRNLGAFAGPSLAEVTQETLQGAIEKAKSETVQTRVGGVGKQIQAEETGLAKCVNLLNGFVID